MSHMEANTKGSKMDEKKTIKSIANNPKFHEVWEDLQKVMGSMLSLAHEDMKDPAEACIRAGLLDLTSAAAKSCIDRIVNMEATEGPWHTA
jgi:hypothetical protein